MNHNFVYTDTRNNHDYRFFEIEVDYTFVTDNNYGADADGNRGVRMSFLDDFSFKIRTEEGEDVTNNIKLNDKELYDIITKKVDEEAEGLDCDEDSYEGSEIEYDNLD